jgi:putative transposase
MTEILLSAKEIADLKGISVQAVHKRAVKDAWSFETVVGRGGDKKQYRFSALPEDIKLLYNKVQFTQPPAPTLSPSGGNLPSDPVAPVPVESLSKTQLTRAAAKTDLLLHYTRALRAAGWGKKTDARDRFVTAYNCGIAYPHLYSVLGAVSWQTIEGWKRTMRTGGDLSDLADRRGKWRRGKSIITAQQARVILECALHPNRPLISEVIREAKKRMHAVGIDNGHSPATYRRFIEEFRRNNFDVWTFTREGAKALNDKALISIERDPSLISVGDILVADGHNLNFEILNPWTGRQQRMTLLVFFDMRSAYPCGWEIMPTENTACISSALRRAILTLGKIPQVVYLDNGRAFGAKYFTTTSLAESGLVGLYERLGIKTIFAWPYHGQSKTVERFFGTFAELERWCPTYSGTGIATKPPRMMRGEFLHRKVYDKIMGGQVLTMEMAHRAIAAWFDEYAARPQDRSKYLMGHSPADLFLPGRGPGVDPSELTYLMLADKEVTVRASRVEFNGRKYYHPELFRRNHKVTIRYDLHDTSHVLVFDRGELLCVATEQDAVHPAATALGTDADREKLAYYCELKKHQEKEASRLSRQILEIEVLPAHRQQLHAAGLLGQNQQQIEQNPATKQITASECAKLEAEVDAYCEERTSGDLANDFWSGLTTLSELDRYERLLEADASGMLIPQQFSAFMKYFEQTPDYLTLSGQGYWQTVKERAAVLCQVNQSTGV